MAIVSVSLDTVTRKAVLTINGVIVSANEFHISQYEYDDGLDLSFSYTIDNVDGNDMKERRSFTLPSKSEATAESLNKDGLISKIVHDNNKVRADIANYLDSRRNS